MYKPKITIITGASSGIGLEFAKLCAGLGSELILISRNGVKLTEIKESFGQNYSVKVHILPCDLTDLNSIDFIKNYLYNEKIVPDLLINNAGIGKNGNYLNIDFNKEREIIQLNITAVTALCKLISKIMIDNDGGKILNVASTLAFRNDPDWAAYAASKSFILSFSRSLALGLRKTNVQVHVLCPGKTDTNFDINSDNQNGKNKGKRSPEFVAKYALKNLNNKKAIIIPGFENKLKYIFFKFLPLNITDRILTK